MSEIFNIFSKNKSKEKQIKKQRIIADIREKNSLVVSYLIEKSNREIEVEFQHLKVGDFIIGDIAIERKTASDFISSIFDKRLENQLEEIKQYSEYFLILEGDINEIDFANKNALRGFLLSIITKYHVPILYSKDEEETAIFLLLLAKKQLHPKEPNIRQNKRVFSKQEQLQYVLEGFPGIGSKTAKKLLSHFKTIKSIMNASQEELKEVIGKKAEVFKIVEEQY